MYREIITDMANWKGNQNGKPLLLLGAKGVGKTWASKDFGSGFFNSTIVIDFEKQESSRYLFQGIPDKERLLKMLDVYNGGKVDSKNTLIILDNIHLVKNPFDLIEFLYLNLAEYYICCISFLRAVLLFGNKDYMLYCDELIMYPLSFGEFLIVNKEFDLSSKIENHRTTPLSDSELKIIENYLKIFYITGGMPLVVNDWITEHNFSSVTEIKNLIINEYKKDFNSIPSKALKNKVFEVWNSIGAQLDKENKKFQYGLVKLTARAREYSESVDWLYNHCYISKLNRVKNAVGPINEHEDKNSYEIFMVDIGLLTTVYDISYNDIKDGMSGILSHNNSLNEQFVFQELLYNKSVREFYYWTSDATARISFIFEDSGQVIPIDVNIDENKKAQSLKVFKERFHNQMSVRITYEKFYIDNGILNIPIYSVWNL